MFDGKVIPGMFDYRVRQEATEEQILPMRGKILTDNERSVTLTGPARVFTPDGEILCVYLPGILPEPMLNASYEVLHTLRNKKTNNRGLASGMVRYGAPGKSRTGTKPIASSIVGAFDPVGPFQYCRKTAFTVQEGQEYERLYPLFQEISRLYSEFVPQRFSVQIGEVRKTKPEWVVPGTAFTTATCNNGLSTGVHTDAGDLREGFSTLAVVRRGKYSGGVLTMPQYRIGVDLQHGDLILMDAGKWHGNTQLWCEADPNERHKLDGWCEKHDVERISLVSYYRTRMAACGTMEQENARRVAVAEKDFTEADEQEIMVAAAVSKGGYERGAD